MIDVIKGLGLPQTIVDDILSNESDVYVPAMNRYLSAVVNKIARTVIESATIMNPFKRFTGFDIEYGDTVENIFVDVPTGYKYNPQQTDPFKINKPTVYSLYVTINDERQYFVTVYLQDVRRAVKSQAGYNALVDKIVASLGKAAEMDDYMAVIALLNNAKIYENSTGSDTKAIEKVNIHGLTKTDVAKKLTELIVKAKDMCLPTSTANALKVLNPSSKNDLVLVIKHDLLESIDLDYLAGVYNLSKIDLISNIIPVENFKYKVNTYGADGITVTSSETKGDDLDLCILDSRGFDFHKALDDAGLIYNPANKATNYYLNDWNMWGFKNWHNARAYKLVDQA